MKNTIICLLLLIASTESVRSQTPTETATKFLQLVKQEEYRRAAGFIDQNEAARALFEMVDGLPVTEVKTLYAGFFGAWGINFNKVEVVGDAAEGFRCVSPFGYTHG